MVARFNYLDGGVINDQLDYLGSFHHLQKQQTVKCFHL